MKSAVAFCEATAVFAGRKVTSFEAIKVTDTGCVVGSAVKIFAAIAFNVGKINFTGCTVTSFGKARVSGPGQASDGAVVISCTQRGMKRVTMARCLRSACGMVKDIETV